MNILKLDQFFGVETYAKISSDMFNFDNIKEIQTSPTNPSLLFIIFHGINGSVPIRFFDEEAQKKIRTYMKIHNSKLWEILNEKK